MKNRYDLIVVGIGAMGSAALYQAAKRGISVLGIDRFTPPHIFGSSHGDTRVTRLSIGEGEAYIPLVNRSNMIWRELEDKSGVDLYHQCGGYIIYPEQGGEGYHGNSNFGADTAVIAKKHHIAHEIRNANQVKAHLPNILMQSDELGYWEPGAGALRVERCIQTQIDLSQKLGAATHFGTAVKSFTQQGEHVEVQLENGTVFVAEKLILTTGGWLPDMLPTQQQALLSVTRQVMYWFEADSIEEWQIDKFPVLLWQGEKIQDFFGAFPTPLDGFQGVKVLTEQFIETTHPDDVAREVLPEEVEHFYDTLLKKKFGGVKRHCLKTAVCLYTDTPNGQFLIDWHPEADRVLYASPCSGHGFKHSAAVGEALVETAVDGKSKIDLSSFAFDNF